MKWDKSVIIFLFLISSLNVHANDSLVNKLLERLLVQQNGQDPYFVNGLFPCYRQYKLNHHTLKKDDNIFFTGLIAFTLNKNKALLSPKNRVLCDSILSRVKKISLKFKNNQGRNTYNFWPTDTVKIFPNSGWINWFDKKNSLADDLDDTAIMLLALNESNSSTDSVHMLMQEFINKPSWPVKNTLDEYKKFGAYSCWFGKKMMVEFDVCTIANVLLMVQTNNLAWLPADTASIELLCHMIEQKHHVTKPDVMSVYYKKTAIILYHLARLMSIKPIPQLEKYKPQLIEEAKNEYYTANNLIDKLILRTALLQFGTYIKEEPLELKDDLLTTIESMEYPFFIANLANTMPKDVAYLFVNAGVSKFHFYCPAFNEVLLLEYILEQEKYNKQYKIHEIKENGH